MVPVAVIGRRLARAAELPIAIAEMRHGMRNRADAYTLRTGRDARMTVWIGIARRCVGALIARDEVELRRLDRAADGATEWIYPIGYGVVSAPITMSRVDTVISQGRTWSAAGAVVIDGIVDNGFAAVAAAVRRAWGRELPFDIAAALAPVRYRGLRIDVGSRRSDADFSRAGLGKICAGLDLEGGQSRFSKADPWFS